MRFRYLFMSPDIKMLFVADVVPNSNTEIHSFFYWNVINHVYESGYKVYFMITFNGYFIKMYLTESINWDIY